MPPLTIPHPRLSQVPPTESGLTFVACPDARPPAYQAVVGLARAGMLDRFLTSFYYGGDDPLSNLGRRLVPERFGRWERRLRRRHDPEIPAAQVRGAWSVDLALAAEIRLATRPAARRWMARVRTRRFDQRLARELARSWSAVALIFSDVGSEFALPTCRRLGIATVLSMVHGDVREEQDLLRREAETAPDYFPIYLGDGRLDLTELDWLHRRRLQDLELADRILVPSEHIASVLAQYGTPREKVRVVPYGADTRRFVPGPARPSGPGCTFLFAGGVTQRKGIKYLLEAWGRVRRPGWRLQLLGALPRDPGPLTGGLDGVEVLGRVGHVEVPERMAAADVFVFPSLFEGSAVVTYEALACGLPSIVTPSAGSVARDGIEGLVVPPADPAALAVAMDRLGSEPDLRARMAAAARARAEAFDWPRYHASVIETVAEAARL